MQTSCPNIKYHKSIQGCGPETFLHALSMVLHSFGFDWRQILLNFDEEEE